MKEFKTSLWCGHVSLRARTDSAREVIKKVCEVGGYDNEVEVIIRIRDKRQDWIDTWYKKAMNAVDHLGNYTLKFCKDTTIMVERDPFPDITTSAPRHGDKYDRKTGIAVCYAKMRGETIPDYI